MAGSNQREREGLFVSFRVDGELDLVAENQRGIFWSEV
jgi:hypothetical protein